jgi:dihydroorotase
MNPILIKDATLVNEGNQYRGSILLKDGKINKIFTGPAPDNILAQIKIINARNKIILPGIIDDHVHFREPGLTHKGDIYSESKAAVAGGVTSIMEMPNTLPQTTTQKALEDKFNIASGKSLTNYSFYIGATNNNLEELTRTDLSMVCGIKVFMGASTGKMLVNNEDTLRNIFSKAPLLVAVHCEDDQLIRQSLSNFRQKYGLNLPCKYHPLIRSEEACYKSSSYAVNLARQYNTRLHVLHLSTARELELFDNTLPPSEKQITCEVCIHHLYFDEVDYDTKGCLIKWNPAIKKAEDREGLFAGILNNSIDIIATDHAPHVLKEKQKNYFEAPSGGPMVQHSLVVMLEFYFNGKISLEKIVEKMCHTPADIFQIDKRGYIREGYWADLVIVDPDNPWEVNKKNILYKCGWSPLEGQKFRSQVSHTLINGHLVFENGRFDESLTGKRLEFNR